jgi:hypothetical protein
MADVVRQGRLVGNKWVLTGAILYLLEWVGIVWASAAGVGSQVVRGTSAADLMDTYTGNENAVYSMAGLFAVVLLGRVLIFIGLRHALADSGYPHALLDLAVVASAVSVTLEVASYGLAASAASSADSGDEALTVVIDQAGAGLNLMIGGGLGVAILCANYVMWRSGLFSLPLLLLGAASGAAIIGAQLTVAPSLQSVFDVLYFFPVVFWIWMLWTGVVCWRSAAVRAVRQSGDIR